MGYNIDFQALALWVGVAAVVGGGYLYLSSDSSQQTSFNIGMEEDAVAGELTRLSVESDPVSGTNNRIILYDQGDRVSGETVYLDGEELGQTGSNGAIEFEVPLQEQITISTDYDLENQTFNVTENHPEPDTVLLSPDDGRTFETVQGETTEIGFEASVEITEDTGTASLMIDGSEAYTQDLSSGTNSISTTQALFGGTHNWQVEVDTPEYNVSSSSRALTVNEVGLENGLSLQSNATAGEHNYVRLYDSGEPVEGTEITVNGGSIGTTVSNGEVGFEVPNEDLIVVRSPEFSESFEVQGYVDPEELELIKPEFDAEYTASGDTATVPLEFRKPVSASYQILLDGEVVEQSEGGKSVNTEIQVSSGLHGLNIRAILENGDTIKTEDTRIQVNQD